MYFQDDSGQLARLPLQWTDVAPDDPTVVVGGGRAHFRYDDLCRLADLLTRLDTTPRVDRADQWTLLHGSSRRMSYHLTGAISSWSLGAWENQQGPIGGRGGAMKTLTIEDLVGGESVDYPQAADVTFKKAQRVRYEPAEKQKDLPMGFESPEKREESS